MNKYTHTYAHPRYSDAVVVECKALYRQYVEHYTPRTAIRNVADAIGMTYSDVASCIATKKKEVSMEAQIRTCYVEMRKESRSKHFAIMDVCDRMRLNYSTVERVINTEELVQLELF